MSADSLQPKPTSDSFKAKRAQHYNEFAAIKAFKRGPPKEAGDSSPESDTSEEHERTKTNTNTNINQTVAKSVEARNRQNSGDIEGLALNDRDAKDRGVSFSGESGGESTEEFRSLRNSHYSQEWKRDPSVPASVSSLETNTNTNLNAGSSTAGCREQERARAKNPMEAARPPVKFGEDSAAETADSSEEFRARRHEHYNEITAVRRFKSESRDEAAEDVAESSDEALHEGVAAMGAAGAKAANPANPMEPREPSVAFQVGGGGVAVGAADGSDALQDAAEGRSAADDVEWRARRQAHYSEMASLLRSSMPPPSDEEEDTRT